MRVSEYFKLGRTQPTLDFIDVDVRRDARLFIDPRALALLPDGWGDECVSLVQDFFKTVLDAIKAGEDVRAKGLLGTLREPNETHLGLSRGTARGRALGPYSASEVWGALKASEAVHTGVLQDLEDSILLIPGIGPDIISDITTNIIRGPLIEYTHAAADLYGIPLTSGVASGPIWDPSAHDWDDGLIDLPMATSGKLLLVPKAIVRTGMAYNAEEYFRHYVCEHLREIELADPRSALVYVIKRSGRKNVTKKSVEAKYGRGKRVNSEQTLNHPEILDRYRRDKAVVPDKPLTHEELAQTEGTAAPDWDALLADVKSVAPGAAGAHAYELAVEKLLAALFYPSLANPQRQVQLHKGSKRIDLAYTNVARDGFFFWLGQHYAAPKVFVECKNYTGDPANPELDQLVGRFSPSRGQVGLLVCRDISKKARFLERCRNSANDGHGYVIPLDDKDLEALVTARRAATQALDYQLLRTLFDSLVM